MKKVLKITESQYRKLLLFEQNDIQLPRGYDKPTPSSTTRVDRTNLNYRNIPEFDPFGDKAKTKKEKDVEEIRVREGYKYHFMCNRFNPRKPKNSKDPRLTIERHSENCHSCTTELRQYCKGKDMVATLLTEKGSFWDEYFIKKGTSELPINGGHWDNDEYTYCVCMSGEERVIDEDVYFIEEGPVINQGKSVVSDKNTLEKQFIKGRQELYSMNDSSTPLYETFDCSSHREKGEWVNYQQCLTENISMAVSVVPVIGTAASAIADFANGISYLASSLFGEKGEETTNLTMAGISFLSIIPGFGEARALLKMSRKSVIATTDVLKKLEKKQFINMVKGGRYDSALSTLEKLEKSNPYSLAKYGIKNVNKVIDNLKTIGNKDFDKYFTEFQKIVNQYEKGGLKRETLNKLMKKNDFVSLVKKHGDINKAMKSQEFKNMLINIGVQVGFGTGVAYLSNYFNNLKKEIENRNFDPEMEKQVLTTVNKYNGRKKEIENYIKSEKLNKKIAETVDNIEINWPVYKDQFSDNNSNFNLETFKKLIDNPDIPDKMELKQVQSLMGTKPNTELAITSSYETKDKDKRKRKIKRKIKVSESQFQNLFLLKEQDDTDDDSNGCTPKFKEVKDVWLNPLITLYNNKNTPKIETKEYHVNDTHGCRFSFRVKDWDDNILECIIFDDTEYKDSGWVVYKYKDKRIGLGDYDTSKIQYKYGIYNVSINGEKLNNDKIFDLFKKLLKIYNENTDTYKKIESLKTLYENIKGKEDSDLTESDSKPFLDFYTKNTKCSIYNYNIKLHENIFSLFQYIYYGDINDDKNLKDQSFKIINKINENIENCKK